MPSPGGFDSGSTTEVDTDNETPATCQAPQYEYIGPLFVRLRVTMGSALFTKLVEQATNATMVALTKEAAMNRKSVRSIHRDEVILIQITIGMRGFEDARCLNICTAKIKG